MVGEVLLISVSVSLLLSLHGILLLIPNHIVVGGIIVTPHCSDFLPHPDELLLANTLVQHETLVLVQQKEQGLLLLGYVVLAAVSNILADL